MGFSGDAVCELMSKLSAKTKTCPRRVVTITRMNHVSPISLKKKKERELLSNKNSHFCFAFICPYHHEKVA